VFAIELTPVIVASSTAESNSILNSVGKAVNTVAEEISIPPGKVVVVVVDSVSAIISSMVSSTVILSNITPLFI